MAKRKILVLDPTVWDDELNQSKYSDKYEFIYREIPFLKTFPLFPFSKFDALAFIDETVRQCSVDPIDGVLGTNDYPSSLMASAVAQHLGLPTPDTNIMLLCSHKYLARQFQKARVPEATPSFDLIDPFEYSHAHLKLEFPFFVKPVKGTMSLMARTVKDFDDLKRDCDFSWLKKMIGRVAITPFNQMLDRYTNYDLGGHYFITEELLHGVQVSIDGFVHNGVITVMGVIDAIMFPNTHSFERFDYPSRLSLDVQIRMENLATQIMAELGFDNGCYNVEMIYNSETDQIHIIEINPRMSSQFADLYEKVDGTNTYDIQLDLAIGKKPSFVRGSGRYPASASCVLRVFEDGYLTRIPDESEMSAVKCRFPNVVIRTLIGEGKKLSSQIQDTASFRYAVINLGACSTDELLDQFSEIKSLLQFEIKK